MLTIRICLLGLVLLGASAGGAQAQTAQLGDPAAGRRLATGWCGACHGGDAGLVEPAIPAPTFAEIANRRATTAFRIGAFLRSPHAIMPNYQLTTDEIEDVTAYILSLRRPHR